MADVSDERFMRAALSLGRRALGRTSSNPPVGCVLVQGDGPAARIVGRGWTAAGGRPHAETIGLKEAGARAGGATAYVTLEPCAHHAVTPPCALALIDAGVRRVVTALEDPDSRVAGRGHDMLRGAGIEVDAGVLEDEARRDLAGYLSRRVRGRPEVTLKLAVSADGRIAPAGGGQPNAITGDPARRRGHLIRARSDAILIGKGTALADNPSLTCRLPGLEDRSPVRVVADARLDLEPASELARTAGETPVWVLAGPDRDPERASALTARGVDIIACALDRHGNVDPAAALRGLAERGINTLMVEGGAKIAANLLKLDCIDRVALFRSPADIGADGVGALAGMALTSITDAGEFRRVDELPLGADRMIAYERVRDQSPEP